MADHKDLNTRNNRWDNLRECSGSQNACNRGSSRTSRTGVKGVFLCKQTGKFIGQVRLVDKNCFRRFNLIEEASEWVEFVREELHGEFSRHSS
jgi:hypothetical protein